jgi:hypothetical protein
MSIPFILILFFHATGGYGIETAALSQQVYANETACKSAAAVAVAMNKDHLAAQCVPSFK